MSVYIIEQAIVFDSDVPSLATLRRSKQSTVISAASARCLAILIEAGGEPIQREQLIHAGWGSLGQVVSENSLNQAITQLRKVLKELEFNGDLILTVPRIGYKLSRLFSIQIGAEEEDISPTEIPLSDPQVVHIPVATQDASLLRRRSDWATWISSGTVRPILLISILIIISYSLFYTTNKTVIEQMLIKFHTVNYLPITSQFNDLNIFYNDGITEQGDYLKNAIKQIEQDSWLMQKLVAEYRYIYINGSYNRDVFSYFLCRDEIQRQPKSCLAYTSIQEGH